MATISADRIASARWAAKKANGLGSIFFTLARILFWIWTIIGVAGICGSIFLGVNDENPASAVAGVVAVIAAWVLGSIAIARMALIGALAQVRAESLEIQLVQAQP